MDYRSDTFYMNEAKEAAWSSRCKKRQLGCTLVFEDGSYVQGTNGAPFPLNACDPCPRMLKNSHSGEDLNLCIAVHAERQALLKAAKYGFATQGARLFSYMGAPCKDCMLELIEAGVTEIICSQNSYYDKPSQLIIKEWVNKGGIFKFLEKK